MPAEKLRRSKLPSNNTIEEVDQQLGFGSARNELTPAFSRSQLANAEVALGNELVLSYFQHFAEIEHNEENILFLMEVGQWHKLPANKKTEDAQRIFKDYCDGVTAIYWCSFSSATFNKMKDALQMPNDNMWDAPVAEIKASLGRDMWKRFEQSPLFKDLDSILDQQSELHMKDPIEIRNHYITHTHSAIELDLLPIPEPKELDDVTIEDYLTYRVYGANLLAFLIEQFAENVMSAALGILLYQKDDSPPEVKKQQAMRLYVTYFMANAPLQVSLESRDHQKMLRTLPVPSNDMFDSILATLKMTLINGYMFEFNSSTHAANLLREQEEELLKQQKQLKTSRKLKSFFPCNA